MGIMGFKEDLAAAKSSSAKTADVDVLVNEKKYTLRFVQVNGHQWAEAVDRSPLRADVPLDRKYGYDLRNAVEITARISGTLLSGSETVELVVSPDTKPPIDEWSDLFAALSGYDFQRVTDVVWYLNEYGPQLATEAAKKAPRVSGKSSR